MGVNGKRDETRNITFQQKTRNREKTGGKHTQKEKKKITRNAEMRQDKISASQDFSETRFQQDFGKCWKQKQCLLECHKTTIQEQKQGLGAGLLSSDEI